MVDLNTDNNRQNAELLLKGMWYSNLPDLLDIEELAEDMDSLFKKINEHNIKYYIQDTDDFISEWSNIVSPTYIRKPGVEALTFYDFKKNKSLREMQVPNLIHYISFIYNTLHIFPALFEELYLNEFNREIVENSNSYLVFEETFALYDSYDETWDWVFSGKFATTNNKMNTSAILSENKKRYLAAEKDYFYLLKMDIESFFPNIYTHNFEKIAYKSPFCNIAVDLRYFKFLDNFNQRINNNQTKGIPAGIFSSHIAAELCMLCVDAEIREYIKNNNISAGYIRYVDDLTFFSDSKSTLSELFSVVQVILNKYRLRINGNKTETQKSIFDLQLSYIDEIKLYLTYFDSTEESYIITLNDFFDFKRYICECLNQNRISQIRTLLSMLLCKVKEDKININEIYSELFYFLLKLSFEEEVLTHHIYRLLDQILSINKDEELINALLRKRNKIDSEYADTLLQVWFYYLVFNYCNTKQRNDLVSSLSTQIYNPLVVASMISYGKASNKLVFKYIMNSYINESKSTNWRSEIMYSKWWVPLFKLKRYDSHNYENFMASKNFPDIYKEFSEHKKNELSNESEDVSEDQEE